MTTPLTIVQAVPALDVGGVERGTVELAIHLQQQGHRSVVVSNGGELVTQLEAHGVTHIKLPVGRKALRTFLLVSKLKKIIQEQQADVVHARSRLPAWLCYFALRMIGSQRPHFVTTLHGMHSVKTYSSIMARGDAVIAVSQCAKQYLQNHYARHLKSAPQVIYRGVGSEFKFQHQPNTQWLERFNKKLNCEPGTQLVLLPGRVTAVKGVENLLPWLVSCKTPVRLLLTGMPDASAHTQRLATAFQKYGVDKRVSWIGTIRQMPDLYAAVDLVVSCNNQAESFGRAVLEALSVGTPVVGYDMGGVAEVMQQIFPQGLVPAGDQQKLADKMNEFLLKPPPMQAQQQFSNAKMFAEVMAVYQSLVRGTND